MTSLVFKMLTWRLIADQWRSLAVAILTVSLGICLAMSIRFGTQSASLSLENNLSSLATPQWVGPLTLANDELPEVLSPLLASRDYRLVRLLALKVRDRDGAEKNLQVSVEWTKLPQVLTLGHMSDQKGSALKLLVAAQCEKEFLGKSMAVADGMDFQVQFVFEPLLNQPCGVGFAFGPQALDSEFPKAIDLSPQDVYLKSIDKIDAENLDQALSALAAQQSGMSYASNKSQLRDLESLIGSLNTNLQLMGLISIFVGIFMVHHVFSMVIARNGKTLAILKSLGLGPSKIWPPLLLLIVLIGVLSSALGSGLGLALGKGLSMVTQGTVQALYDSRVSVDEFYWSPRELIFGFLLGTGACLVGGLQPLLLLRKIDAAEVLRTGVWRNSTGNVLFARICLILSPAVVFLLLKFPIVYQRLPLGAFVACFVIMLSAALLSKELTFWAYKASAKWSDRLDFFQNLRIFVPPQSAVVVQVLTLCFSLTLSVKSMSESFRYSLESWVLSTLKADLWIRSRDLQLPAFPDTLITQIDALRNNGLAKAVDGLKVLKGTLVLPGNASQALFGAENRKNDRPIAISAVRLGEQYKVTPLNVIGQTSEAQSELSLAMSNAAKFCLGTKEDPCPAYVSEPLSVHAQMNLQSGIVFLIKVRGQGIWFRASGYFQDFGNDQGSILTDVIVLNRLLQQEFRPGFMNVYLSDAKNLQSVHKQIESFLHLSGRKDIEVLTLKNLRDRILIVFEQTFRITDALYVLSAIVAFVSVLSSLSLQTLLRKREWNILWATGISARILRVRTAVWAGHAGLWSYIVSLPGALGTALVLVYVVNYYSFGFSLSFSVPWVFLLGMAIVAWVAGFKGGWVVSAGVTRQLNSKNLSIE